MHLTIFLLTGFLSLTTIQAKAEGFRTVRVGGNFTVGDSETKTLNLDAARHVRNIVVQAEGIRQDSVVEVMVNGQVKGTIFAPGRDPSYIVTIAETTRSIEFRHRGGAAMQIHEVLATVSDWSKPGYEGGGGFYGDKNRVKELASVALRQVEVLRRLSLPEEDKEFLFPIKKNAGLVFVMVDAHGNISKRTVAQLHALIDQIDFAQSFLNGLMQREEGFEAVVDLLTVRETLNDMLD